jgi:diguanylate cyclase (GGDEF)-like protein
LAANAALSTDGLAADGEELLKPLSNAQEELASALGPGPSAWFSVLPAGQASGRLNLWRQRSEQQGVTRNTRDAAADSTGGAGATNTLVDPSFDSRSGFDDVRHALSGQIEREVDSLLLARAALDRLLNALLVRAPQRRSALGLVGIEIEDWKAQADRLGQATARKAFAQLARELRQRVRTSDELGRLGDGQIAVVLVGCEAHVLGGVAERLRLALDGRVLGEVGDTLRASLSVAIVPAYPRAGGPSAAALLTELTSALA